MRIAVVVRDTEPQRLEPMARCAREPEVPVVLADGLIISKLDIRTAARRRRRAGIALSGTVIAESESGNAAGSSR